MGHNITAPERFIHTMMVLACVRAQEIQRLNCLNEEEKRLATDDMVNRIMRDVKIYGEMG